MDPFQVNNQPAPANQPPPQYNPFSEGPGGAQQQPYNPYEQQQSYSPANNGSPQQGFQQPQYGGAQQPQQGFFNSSAQYQSSNVAYNPNPNQQQPQFQQPNLSNAPPAPGQGAAPQRPFNQYAPTESAAEHKPVEPTSKFWTIQFYQQFFDVDTRQVLLRMGNTLLPITCPDFLSDLGWHWNANTQGTHGPETSGQPGAAPAAGAANPNNFSNIGQAAQSGSNMFETANGVLLNKSPDLYGPVWICTTLWMLTAIISNILSKISHMRTQAQEKENAKANGLVYKETQWSYDFTQATVAMGTIYLYVVLMSLILWGISRWKDLPIKLTHCLCTYGYSMFLFILAAILCIIPVGVLQWLACMIGCTWSAAYIIMNFWFVWRNTLEKAWFIGVLALVALCHFGLGMAFRFYFFSYDL